LPITEWKPREQPRLMSPRGFGFLGSRGASDAILP